MTRRTIRLVDSGHAPVAVATVTDVGDHFAGTIDLSAAPPAVLAVFRELEEVVNGQMFSFLDEVEAKVGALGLCAELSAGTFTAIKDLQIYPSQGGGVVQVGRRSRHECNGLTRHHHISRSQIQSFQLRSATEGTRLNYNTEFLPFALTLIGLVLISFARVIIRQPTAMMIRCAVAVGVMAAGSGGVYGLVAGEGSEPLVGAVLVIGVVLSGLVRLTAGLRRAVRKTRRRTVWCATVLASSILIGANVLLNRLYQPEPQFPGGFLQDAIMDQVRPGMSRNQVWDAVGPPRDLCHGHRSYPYAWYYREKGYESWIGWESELLVLFDGEGRVSDVKRGFTFSTGKRHHWWE